jgi:thioredoxin-like negative regulator of GroEL
MNVIQVLFAFLLLPTTIGFSVSQPNVENSASGKMPRESVGGGEKTTIQTVEELTTSNFDSTLRQRRRQRQGQGQGQDDSAGIWLIEFYAPWCHHCTAFASHYENIARKIHASNDSRDRPIHVAKINGNQERSMASRFSIRGYPSFFVIDGWNVYEYQGRRTEESILNFVVHEEYKNQHVRSLRLCTYYFLAIFVVWPNFFGIFFRMMHMFLF